MQPPYQKYLIGNAGTSYLPLQELIDISAMRVNEIRKRITATHHRDVTVDERIIIHLADTILHLYKLLGKRNESVYEILARRCEAYEIEIIEAKIRSRNFAEFLKNHNLVAEFEDFETKKTAEFE